MSVTDILKTIAILDDSEYIRAADRMAKATERAGGGAGLERLAGGLTLAGGLMMGLGAKAIKAASDFQQLNQSLDTLYGKATGDKLFGDLKNYTFSTPYTTKDWADQARMLAGFKVQAEDLIPTLKDLGDAVTAGNGVDVAKLQQVAYAYGEMNIGFANLRHVRMFQTAHVDAIGYIQKNMGLTEDQVANIGKMHIPGGVVNAAITYGIESDPSRHDAMLKFMKTLKGEASNLNDAWQMFLANAGTGALEPVAHGIHFIADEVKRLSNPNASKAIGWGLLFGGPALLATGPIIKAISLWNQMKTAKNLAAVAANTEKAAELEKLPVLDAETDKVVTATSRWGALGTTLLGVAKAAGKLYLAYAAIQTVKELAEMHDPEQRDREQFKTDRDAFNNNQWDAVRSSISDPGRTLTYGWKATGSKGNFERLQAEALRIIRADKSAEGVAAFMRSKPEIDHIIKNWSSTPNAVVGNMASHLATLVNNADAYKASGAGDLDARQAKAKAAAKKILDDFQRDKAKYTKTSTSAGPMEHLDADLDRAETMMKIAKINYEHDRLAGGSGGGGRHGKTSTIHGPKGHGAADLETSKSIQDEATYNKFRKQALVLIDQSIASHQRYAASIEHVAGKAKAWLAEEKKILALKEKRAEYEHDDLAKKSGGDGFNKVLATVISSAGLSEEEVLKRTGVGRKMFAQSKPAPDPLASALKSLPKQQVHVHVNVGGKTTETITVEVVNQALHEIIKTLEGSTLRTIWH